MKNAKRWLQAGVWATLLTFVVPLPSFAQGEDEGSGDVLDDILKDDDTAPSESSVRTDAAADVSLPEEQAATKRLIKTLQRKTFLKIGRGEIGPHVGFVTNDPFINRYLVGASATWHFTEVFGGGVSYTFSPDFGTGDWKPITDQLVNENKVSPDISKIRWYADVDFHYSPIYGKIAVLGRNIINFDFFGSFGMGLVRTHDDLVALQAENEPSAIATEYQFHPTTTFGGGFRVIFSKSFSARIEGRSLIYIETINSTTLEMKNNFILQGSTTFFFPGMKP